MWVERMSEHNQQVFYFAMAKLKAVSDKRWESIFAVPNAFKRTPRQGKWMKDEGLKAGVPDIMVAVPSSGYHGLFIELKVKGGRVSASQKGWLERLNEQGYKAVVCYGGEEALEVTEEYFNG